MDFNTAETQALRPESREIKPGNRQTDQVIEIRPSDFLEENIIDIKESDLIYED